MIKAFGGVAAALVTTVLAAVVAVTALAGGMTGAAALADALPTACAGTGPVEGLDESQARNARTIVAVGDQQGVGEFGLVIALATAFQESSLYNLEHGDRDSLGLFQQRPSTGWGTPGQVSDPVYAARAFFGGPHGPNSHGTGAGSEPPGLLDVAGWRDMPLTEAAQAVQRSAFPNAYARHEQAAWAWLAAIRGTPPADPAAVEETSGGLPDAEDAALVGCRPDGRPIVGGIEAVRARAQQFVAASAAGLPDPFYGAAHYYRLCARLAARVHGHVHAGHASARAQWESYLSQGVAHPGDADPPPGALVFWASPPDGHVAVYLGDGQVVTNDVYDQTAGRRGGVYLAPVEALGNGPWRLRYLGWAPPVY